MPPSDEILRPPFHSGFVAIVGRANVGKSTILNALLGQKLSIVSAKPHTTRHKLLGVLHGEDFQAALLDTPGFLRNRRDQLDASMARQFASALSDADLVLLVAESRMPGDVEEQIIAQLLSEQASALLVLNKIDTVAKSRLLPIIQRYSELYPFQEIIPISAIAEQNIDLLATQIATHLPEQDAIFLSDVLTDRSVRFLCAEIIREKVFSLYEHEIPYDVAVEIEEYADRTGREPSLVRASIYVDKRSQKILLIGKEGRALKEVGMQARLDIEDMLGRPFFIELWVKINPKWRQKAGFVQRFL